MLTHEDIVNLTEYQKTVFATIKQVEDLENKVDEHHLEVIEHLDKLYYQITRFHDEMLMVNERLQRHEEWIKAIAEKVGLQLSH